MRREIDAYLAYAVSLGRSERSVLAYRARLTRFLDFAAQQDVHAVQNVTAGLAGSYHDALRKQKLKASSRLAFLSTLRDFLRWAREAGLLASDVASRIELPKPGKRLPPKPLTKDDIAALFAIFPSETEVSLRNRAILELFYACGLRRSELMNLNVSDVDFPEQTVLVRSGKGNKDRLLPVHRQALDTLTACLATRPPNLHRTAPLFVTFRTPGPNRLTASDITVLFCAINRLFHRHVYPHLIRHTFAMHLLQGGADVRHVQALLGHESPDTTSLYLGLVKSDLKKAYDEGIQRILYGQMPSRRRPPRRKTAGAKANRALRCPFGRVECPHALASPVVIPAPGPDRPVGP